MRIILVGGKEHGYQCLKELLRLNQQVVHIFALQEETHEISSFTQKIKEVADKKGIPFLIPKKNNINKYKDIIDSLKPDFMLVIKGRTIISKDVYSIPQKGTAVIHESLLPKYRGFAPLNWAIINGEEETGATLFFMEEEVDSGPILAQKKVSILLEETVHDVERKIVGLYVTLVRENIPLIEAGKFKTIPQDHSQATYTCCRTPEDGRINWSNTAAKIYNLIRALTYPYPGAHTFFNKKKLTIWSADLLSENDKYVGRIPGRIIKIERDIGVQVLTGKGVVRVKKVHFENGEKINSSKLIKSIKIKFE